MYFWVEENSGSFKLLRKTDRNKEKRDMRQIKITFLVVLKNLL